MISTRVNSVFWKNKHKFKNRISMSNISLIIEERAANIGNFMVGRLLPFRQKRSVGPFVFIDHMGPADLKDYENLDVPPHPHIGLSTLTYLFEGAMMHRDSIGNEIEIKPGAVNWMTAGKGVVHSERTPEYLRNSNKRLHGLQIWVALPKHLEEIDPSFIHIEAENIPYWEDDGLKFKLIAGEAFGKKSPVPVHSPLYFIEIKSTQNAVLSIGKDLFGESALYILEGQIKNEGNVYGTKQILIANDSKLCEFEMEANSTIYIFGGESFPEERFIQWNFVSSDKTRLEKAKFDWINQHFPKIPGETDFVPYPQLKSSQ
jgi:redox-sensitive bicupin YhaK (pirin superfamily)